MDKFFYSESDFKKLRDRINHQLKRRGTFKFWDPLVQPEIGVDQSSPLSLPNIGERTPVTDLTYTVNETSFGSIEETNSILFPSSRINPEGLQGTSGAKFDYKEAKNFLVGLAKIHDINLFYGRDEKPGLAFRDYKEIEKVVKMAEDSVRSEKVGEISSGESDGEELDSELGPNYFFDDYGAPEGVGDFSTFSPHISKTIIRTEDGVGNNRDEIRTDYYGDIASADYGRSPRNPAKGSNFRNRDKMAGVDGACNVACTGLCFLTCDDACSESCTSTCFGNCGTGCSSSCGNECSGCSSQCFNSCRTKCENSTGYACVNSGAETIKIESTGGVNGVEASNRITVTTRSCNGCSFSCQFYPNKKTSCWDSACMGMCFISCLNACSESCYGGCINNDSSYNENLYKSGVGKGCSSNCTVNCVGNCSGVCSGLCTETCHKACKETCRDNCTWTCDTTCGNGCSTGCRDGCGGCTSCENYCTLLASHYGCTGCGTLGGCTSTCKMGCDKNCVGEGCRSICGTESAGACESNCRLSCMNSSCTALCSNACVSFCTTCVNTCGFQCGACSSACSVGCSQECNITCTENCAHSCSLNCVRSCTDNCGGCTNLCYSCTGFCIGVCSFKCQNGCSIACSGTCNGGCDELCTKTCLLDCNSRCISSCSGSCSTFLKAETEFVEGMLYDPTSEDYICPHPMDRIEERESLVIIRRPKKNKKEIIVPEKKLISITVDDKSYDINNNNFVIIPESLSYTIYQTSTTGGVFTVDRETGEITINYDILEELVGTLQPNLNNNLTDVWVIKIPKSQSFSFSEDDIDIYLPFWFTTLPIIELNDSFVIIIKTNKEVLIDTESVYVPPRVITYNSDWVDMMTGSGTELDPYLIYTPKDFVKINDDMSAHYKLMNNLDFESLCGIKIEVNGDSYSTLVVNNSAPLYNNGEGYRPIGYDGTGFFKAPTQEQLNEMEENFENGIYEGYAWRYQIFFDEFYATMNSEFGLMQPVMFRGELDGNNKRIKGIYSKPLNTYSVGLFQIIGDNCTIKNLMIEDSVFILSNTIKAPYYGYYRYNDFNPKQLGAIGSVAGIIGYIDFSLNNCSLIQNVYNYATLICDVDYSNNLEPSVYAGGIIGWINDLEKTNFNKIANYGKIIISSDQYNSAVGGITPMKLETDSICYYLMNYSNLKGTIVYGLIKDLPWNLYHSVNFGNLESFVSEANIYPIKMFKYSSRNSYKYFNSNIPIYANEKPYINTTLNSSISVPDSELKTQMFVDRFNLAAGDEILALNTYDIANGYPLLSDEINFYYK